MRLAIEEATSMEMEDMMLVVKKSDPQLSLLKVEFALEEIRDPGSGPSVSN